jgi:glucose/arabinose dehydrogenase
MNKKILVIIGIFSIISLTGWFIFGWLYGKNPSLNTFPRLINSYFDTSKDPNFIPPSNNLISADAELNYLKIDKNFGIKVFAKDLGGPKVWVPGNNWGVRQMATKNNIIYTTLHKDGKVVALIDKNTQSPNAQPSQVEQKTFVENLSLPHGIEVYGDWIYIAENDKITRIKDSNGDGIAEGNREKILDLPPFLEHWTRTVKIFEDRINDNTNEQKPYLFVSIGSSCNSCIESNSWRASIIRCEVDGKNCQVYANGLRNTVDFVKYRDKIFATDAGKDFLGNRLPPEEVNIIQKNSNYG